MAGRRWRVPARIETERLTLRCYVPADAGAMDEVIPANRAHLIEFMTWAEAEPIGPDNRRALVEKFIADYKAGTDEFAMGIFTHDEEYIGGTGYHAHEDHLEIGYWLAEHAQGHGLVTEAAGALTRVALQLAFSPFAEICCDPSNLRSQGVPRRLGYSRCGFREVEGRTQEVWQLTEEAFPDSPASAEPYPQLFDANGSPTAWPV